MNICQAIKDYGVDNIRVIMPGRVLHNILFISYTSSNDAPVLDVVFKVVEERYKLKDNYKIELRSERQDIAKEAFYMTDLNSLVSDGHALVVRILN